MPYLSLVAGRLPLSRYGTSFRNLVRMPDKMSLDGALIITRFYPHLLLGMRIARQHGLRPIVLEPGPARLSFPSFCTVVRLYERVITALESVTARRITTAPNNASNG